MTPTSFVPVRTAVTAVGAYFAAHRPRWPGGQNSPAYTKP